MVHSLLREQGVTYKHGAFVHTPVYCPSRTSLLTGRYIHHEALSHNNSIEGTCYGNKWKEWMEPHDTFSIHIEATGYITTLYMTNCSKLYSDQIQSCFPVTISIESNESYVRHIYCFTKNGVMCCAQQ